MSAMRHKADGVEVNREDAKMRSRSEGGMLL
jgi:hypothetical protein